MKNKIWRILLCSALLLLCISLFTGCQEETEIGPYMENEGESETDPTEASATEKAPETLDDTKFNIFFKREYLCAFVLPAEPTEAEEQVAEELKALMKEQTGEELSFISDGDSVDGYNSIVLIGNTKYDESKSARALLSEREAIIEVKNNKLVIAFADLPSGLGAVRTLMKELADNEKGQMRLSFSYKEIYQALPPMEEFPLIEGYEKEIDCGENTFMKYFSNALVSEFEDYRDQIDEAGFEKLSEREEKGNRFATFAAEDGYAYLYYTEYSKEIRLVTGPIEALALEDYSTGAEENTEAYIASIPQTKPGQGYIFRLPDGRFIIQDGGYKDNDRVYKALRALAPKGEITIAAWFISHPHGDHYPAFIDFIKNHNFDKSIKIERLIHNYANYEMYNINGSAGKEENGPEVQALYAAVAEYMPDLPVIKAHTGQVMKFGSATVEVLYTIEDLLPKQITNINDSSMVIRLNIAGNSIMILADTCYTSGPILNSMWGDYLKSDIAQMAHHSMWPSVESIYHSMQAEVLLHSTMYSGLKEYIKPTQRWAKVMEVAFSYAKDMHVSDSLGEVIKLPYVIRNNKDEMLEYIKNY